MCTASKGNASFLLKPGTKRRRTKIEMEEAKAEDKCREEVVADKNREIQSLKNELGAIVG